MLPRVEMTGNLVDAPELRFTPSGAAVARFRVACTERVQNRETREWKDGDTCFLSVEVWRQQAENIAESLDKGMTVTVIGRLRQRNYETREGEKRTVYEVKGDDVSVALSRQVAKVSKAGAAGSAPSAAVDAWDPAPSSSSAPAAASSSAFDSEPPF